jgi:hypothetical protein
MSAPNADLGGSPATKHLYHMFLSHSSADKPAVSDGEQATKTFSAMEFREAMRTSSFIGAVTIGAPWSVWLAGAVLGVASIMQNFFGHPDCSKIATTQIVNQAEVFLRQNLAAWKLCLRIRKRQPQCFSKKKVLFFLRSGRTKKCHKGRRFSQQEGQHGC